MPVITKLTIVITLITSTLCVMLFARSANSDNSLHNLAAPPADNNDPYIWLEEITSTRSLEWVHRENQTTFETLTAGSSDFATTKAMLKDLYTSSNRLPNVTLLASGYLYEFMRDANHAKGIWRRVTIAGAGAAEIPWEPLLDLDQLATSEHENWAWGGVICREPDTKRCLVRLSHGGRDAIVVREFDMNTKRFVADGFVLPEVRQSLMQWIDDDTLLVATDFGPGTLTAAGQPTQVRLWHRGSPLEQASIVYTGRTPVFPRVYRTPTGGVRLIIEGTRKMLLRDDGSLVDLPLPSAASIENVFHDRLLLRLSAVWNVGGITFSSGSLVSYHLATGATALVYQPTTSSAIESVKVTRDEVIVSTLDHVNSRILAYSLSPTGENLIPKELPLPSHSSVGGYVTDPFATDLLVTAENFLMPPSLYHYSPGASLTLLRQEPARFDGSGLTAQQHEAVSRDGTKIPYFIVYRQDMVHNGRNPTLLYGYGGFGAVIVPTYSASLGKAWLAGGGVYVLANIRGGGEFGPAWYEAARARHRQRSFDDFIAVAEDLIRMGVTSPRHLGIQGGSNGGLLVGAVMVQRPELFHAVVCEVPMLDMVRYPLIGTGASFIEEYGDPTVPGDLEAILRYSPYQNLRPDRIYPKPFFTTSTTDDRVTPAHARKMAAKMAAYGQPRYFYETAQGGHSGASSADEKATSEALTYTYLYQQLWGVDK